MTEIELYKTDNILLTNYFSPSFQSITIYDQLGREILSNRHKSEIDVKKLVAGIYFGKVVSNDGLTGFRKIIKEE